MTATSHALVGGVIAATIPDPSIGLPLAAISHPLLDLIPHWDVGFNWRKTPKLKLFRDCVIDLTLGVTLAYILFGQEAPLLYFLGAIFVSEVWDLLEAPYWFLKWDFPPFSWIYEFGHRIQNKAKPPFGIITQIVVVTGIILVLKLI
ncbi:hypothetical protein A3A14_00535 [Candidatus Daviesbacteria bacterium RIFCSPLOWO2_01_FULL_43_38]|uniref:Uncharacterized protein n=3 Tax=Candidatus Daviesiibacteriota TaxID=1752718 RepID=A0A1F5K2E0_9BACT|nr:MAG: hypothetical protein UV33_C0025G0002 [Candidatus Daviesbacteria bacterium GW2011_GWA1_42_6]KKS70401.1 MAG: hypothetical protein UV41_C0024G0005 [Candidatus Daviesbacteria bacterium GW2011_GWA2_42_7]OGE20534.1 MAG: hypothetical protein A2874_01585 [Candidatus Daviesbacteria bacterium RIFCSPHIGHO2_01_FULL_43_17]OGE35092.1 MAG: hypothetical protein A3E45_03105 [Candidatus Daviesbacteria bacterium RIFCSPHIGHO2_12_FULL_43_11]OGE63730.1 MAG: hypothetical protein A3A14_00535 [Candidatus Davies